MMARLILTLSLIASCFGLPASAQAACKQETISVEQFQKASKLGHTLLGLLEKYNPAVALVGRAGTDLTEHGLSYSHVGLVFRDHPKGKWIFTHLLVKCGEVRSKLFDEGLITFFTDNPYRYQAVLAIPDVALQAELQTLLLNGTAKKLHEEKYSVIANPDQPEYQNSNQWVLEMIAIAKSIYLPGNNRNEAIYLAKEYGFEPSSIKLGFLKRNLAAVFHPNVKLDDHSNATRTSGRFPVVTVKSINDFLRKNKNLSRIIHFDADSFTTQTVAPVRPNSTTPDVVSSHRGHRRKANKTALTSANQFWN